MTYNGQNFFKIHEQHREESRMMEALSEGTLPLNEKEMEIIDAIWGKEPMSVTKIAEVTNISRSTVDQRLKALEKSNKGEWIVSLKGNKGKLFIADMNKKRDWAY
jgi:DNA-binding MarR family transcriptional regulator